jgi:hypothetical protein
LISEIEIIGQAEGIVGVITTGIVGVGVGEGASVLLQAKQNRIPKIKITLFIVYYYKLSFGGNVKLNNM